jgi:hypothetical protein
MDDTKRKKSKGIKTRTAVEKKRKATKKRRKKTAFTDEQIEATREKLKKEFEEEKAEILAELPKEYKNLWGQCGFAKWGKAWLPCLFVSPFDVGGSQMRDDWMKMYNGVSINSCMYIDMIEKWYFLKCSLVSLADTGSPRPNVLFGILVWTGKYE